MATDLVTDRQAWLESRRHWLGSTDVSAILGINPWRTAYEVWLDKTGKLDDWEGNNSTELGHILEPAILDEAERRWGPLERQKVVRDKQAPLASTLDGWLIDQRRPVEAKTAGLTCEWVELGHWGESGTDEIPDWYLVQNQTQLACTDSDLVHVLALIAGRGLVEYSIARDQKIIDMIRDKCSTWWYRHIVEGYEPSRDVPPDMDVIKRIRREPKSVVNLTTEASFLVDQWETAKKVAKEAEEAAEKAKAIVALSIGTSEAGILPDGRQITYMEQHRKGYMVQDTSFRVLRVKNAPKKGKK